MKTIITLVCFATLFGTMLLFTGSCSSASATQERRNLMMPHLSEMPRNSQKFKEPVRKAKKPATRPKSNRKPAYYSSRN